MSFRLTDSTIDPVQLRSALLSPTSGAYCSYEGWVRDHNQGLGVAALHYKAYPELAPNVAADLLTEAATKFAIEKAAIVHRTGSLQPGDIAVWIGVTAHHRGAAFAACRYLIDQSKERLPIWKQEIYTDGSRAWIENHDCQCGDSDHTDTPIQNHGN
ncbi:MAG: molybdenum cofactor biosynthesis protein MoaE [Coraliomargaritaceae bacterium]